MKKKTSPQQLKLANLNAEQIEAITKHAESRSNVPLISSKQVNMRLEAETLAKARKLAALHKQPVTTFLTGLLKEDIARLWSVYEKAG